MEGIIVYMSFNIKTMATLNIVFQILLMILLSFAVFLATRKDLRKHCNTVRIAVLLQAASIIIVMLPSMLGYLNSGTPGVIFYNEMLFHHILGLILIGLWIYINLAYSNIIRRPGNFKSIMKYAFITWTLAFIIGLHLYIRIYL